MSSSIKGDEDMSSSSLYHEVQRIAAENPSTRKALVPILRKFASTAKTACTCPAGIGHNASDYDVMADDDGLMAREWGRAIHRKIIDDTPIIGDPTGTRGNPGGAYGKYDTHENSPPAGADGSPQRKKYNEWYRKNVCPDKDGCGAPWLAKSASESGQSKSAGEKVLYTVSINVPKDSAKEVQEKLDRALVDAIRKIKGMESIKNVTSHLRD